LLATNSSDPGDIRQGVLYTGQQTLLNATSGLTVTVPALHFVGSKAYSNGAYLGFNPTTATVTVPAAPTVGLKRIDVLYVVQQDAGALVSADGTTAAAFGVHAGIASSTPLKPALTDAPAAPVGAIEVGAITWDSTSSVPTATNASAAGASCTLATTCLWTTTRGAPVPARNATERDATLTPWEGLEVYRLDLHAVDTYSNGSWGWQTYTPTITGATTNPTLGTGGSATGRFQIDDKTVTVAGTIHFGTGATFGSGTYSISLPLPVSGSAAGIMGGQVVVYPGGSFWGMGWALPAGSAFQIFISGSSTGAGTALLTGTSTPIGAAFAAGAEIRWNLTYEAA
jgi:hypothetical protein